MSKKNKPVSGTREWAATSVNCTTGCKHDCRYCYAKRRAIKEGKITPAEWKMMKNRPLVDKFSKRNGTVMFPTTHDITRENIGNCAITFKRLLQAGNRVLVVSKPCPEIISHLMFTSCKHKEQVLFRFTIGSINPNVLKYWEPGAPTFAERLYSLMLAFKGGWATSVSMEPMLDEDKQDTLNLVEMIAPYITDAIWLGKANHMRDRCLTNLESDSPFQREDLERMINLLESSQTDNVIRWLYETVQQYPQQYPKVKWKESIKKVVGLPLTEEPGLDI